MYVCERKIERKKEEKESEKDRQTDRKRESDIQLQIIMIKYSIISRNRVKLTGRGKVLIQNCKLDF